MNKFVAKLLALLLPLGALFFFALGLSSGIASSNRSSDDNNVDDISNAGIVPPATPIHVELELVPEPLKPIYEDLSKKYDIPWSIIAAIHKVNKNYTSDLAGLSNTAKNGEDVPYTQHFLDAGKKYGIDPNLLKAIAKQESDFNPNKISGGNAQGIMQLSSEDCKEVGLDPNGDCADPAKNIDGGAKKLAAYLKKYQQYDNQIILSLAAYDAGPDHVDGNPPKVPDFPQIQDYIEKVSAYYEQFKKGEIPEGTPTVKIDNSTFTPPEKVKELLDKFAKDLQNRKNAHEKKPETACMKDLRSRKITEVREGKVGGYGSVTCVIADYMQNNWALVAEIEKEARRFDGTVLFSGMGVPSQSGQGLSGWVWPVAASSDPIDFPVCEVAPWGEYRGHYYHAGVDIGAPIGTPILAAADGVVYRVKGNPGGFGWYIGIVHDEGLVTWYGHSPRETITVKAGQKVKAGQVIAKVGREAFSKSTDPSISSPAHVHFEVHLKDVGVIKQLVPNWDPIDHNGAPKEPWFWHKYADSFAPNTVVTDPFIGRGEKCWRGTALRRKVDSQKIYFNHPEFPNGGGTICRNGETNGDERCKYDMLDPAAVWESMKGN